ncbi:Deleted in malignant brain tumors 1 protein [Fukomys damarensis]|uniref:Deleted in malignant brain tumors 1 protein n=1 Tax=Fukomys damarensis TaxID=885580 RepID=A0A091DXH1_FUKDA|nr:Deleted in malignant brain tumors 1 protein [Fukomys damarensis]
MTVVFHSDTIITNTGFLASYESLEEDENDTDVALRLSNGSHRCEVRIELHYSGSWGTVCDDSWDLYDAQVVCRQLGCGRSVSALSQAHFERGVGPMALDDVECVGTEARLWQCLHGGWFTHNCGHHEDAGAICSDSPLRLVGGQNRCEGRLEVRYLRPGLRAHPAGRCELQGRRGRARELQPHGLGAPQLRAPRGRRRGLLRCIKDNTYVNLHSTQKNVAQFKFNVFSVLDSYDVVYLQCKIVMCRKRDYSSRSSQGCMERKRRDADPLEPKEEQTKHFQIVGPLEINKATGQRKTSV